jgi:hypothetical protein
MIAGSCPSRAESSPLNTKTISLVFYNYFPTNPNASGACADNSAPLTTMMQTCYEADGKRWPNFIAVDFYQVLACIRYVSYFRRAISAIYIDSFFFFCVCGRGVMVEEPPKL